MKMKKKLILDIIGITLIIIGIYRLFQIVYIAEDFPRYFWLCNSSPLILGFAIIFRSTFVLIGEFSCIFFAQLVWTIDFFYFIFTNSFLTGSSAYVINEVFFSQLASISIHVLTLPLSFLAIILIKKPNRNAWRFPFIFFPLIFIPTMYYGRDYNLNFFFGFGNQTIPIIPFYSVIFPLGYIFFIVFPLVYFFNYIIRKIRKYQLSH